MSAPIDIYTGLPIVAHSREHVIPDFLGGRMGQRGLIDKQTNDYFGRTIDASLSNALQPIRVLLDGRNDRSNESPRSLKRIQGDDGREYEVAAGGVVRPIPNMEIRRDGGLLHIDGKFPDTAGLKRNLRQYAKREELDGDELVAQALNLTKLQSHAPPRVSFKHDLYNADSYRAVAKIACNLLAVHDAELFRQAAFNPIRRFVLDGFHNEPAPVQAVRVDVGAAGASPLDHFAAVRSDASGIVTALVAVFGALAFLMRLGRIEEGVGVASCYRVSQAFGPHGETRDRRNDPADLAIQLPDFDAAVARTFEEFLADVQISLETLLPQVLEIQKALNPT